MRSKKEPKRLVVVTNREPFHLFHSKKGLVVEKTPGGLTSAILPSLKKKGGLWVSAAPDNTHELKAALQKEIQHLNFEWLPVEIPKAIQESYYLQFSNRILWPLYHSMLGNMAIPAAKEFEDFKKANEIFAEAMLTKLSPKDFVWIHDFHLSLLPELLRNKLASSVPIGFFLHIPFPAYDLFRTLPWRTEILKGMLGAHLIGFHTEDYVRHFLESVHRILGYPCNFETGEIIVEGRKVKAKAFPISIDTSTFYRVCETKTLKKKAASIRKEANSSHLVLGVDRLDYTKGIAKRLKAFETFLTEYPEYRGQITLIQVAVPSRTDITTYQLLRQEIERQVGHINGLFAHPGWTPVTYMCRGMAFKELLALYYAADIALVTPLRDGMNLVAKEFVATHKDRAGVLILSELAGAAAELKEALLVNPYDVEGMSFALAQAVNMPKEEQKIRMQSMNQVVNHYDVFQWVKDFIKEGRL